MINCIKHFKKSHIEYHTDNSWCAKSCIISKNHCEYRMYFWSHSPEVFRESRRLENDHQYHLHESSISCIYLSISGIWSFKYNYLSKILKKLLLKLGIRHLQLYIEMLCNNTSKMYVCTITSDAQYLRREPGLF